METSVVIPVYNRAHLIERALDSLSRQSYKNFEAIIIDDGSSDNIDEVLNKYKHSIIIRHVVLTHSGNIAYLRNYGIKMSNSCYIAMLDSDDWCMYDRLEKQVKYMNEHLECDILATWVSFMFSIYNKNIDWLNWLYNMSSDRREIIKRCLNDGCCLCNSTVLMRRNKIVELGGYDEEMYICEDFNLWIRAIIKNYCIHILPEKLTVRRIHKESITSEYNGSELPIQLVIRNKIKYLKEFGKLKKQIVVWGINSRNDILLRELWKNNVVNIQIIDVYSNILDTVDMSAYHLITTYSKKYEVFEYLNDKGLSIVDDYIYI